MKNLYLFLFLVAPLVGGAQFLDVGVFSGITFDNINDSRSDFDRTVIGTSLVDFQYGANVTYQTAPVDVDAPSLRFSTLFKYNLKGVVSETNERDRYEFRSVQLGGLIGIGGYIGSGFNAYFDLGAGMNWIDNQGIYEGVLDPLEAFVDLSEPLEVKEAEVTILMVLGLEKYLTKRLKAYLDLMGDFGVTEINRGVGAYRTSGGSINIGLRYELMKKTM